MAVNEPGTPAVIAATSQQAQQQQQQQFMHSFGAFLSAQPEVSLVRLMQSQAAWTHDRRSGWLCLQCYCYFAFASISEPTFGITIILSDCSVVNYVPVHWGIYVFVAICVCGKFSESYERIFDLIFGGVGRYLTLPYLTFGVGRLLHLPSAEAVLVRPNAQSRCNQKVTVIGCEAETSAVKPNKSPATWDWWRVVWLFLSGGLRLVSSSPSD